MQRMASLKHDADEILTAQLHHTQYADVIKIRDSLTNLCRQIPDAYNLPNKSDAEKMTLLINARSVCDFEATRLAVYRTLDAKTMQRMMHAQS